MRETDLVGSILLRCSDGKTTTLFRNNVGELPDAHGRWIKFGLVKGASDILGWTVRDGRAVFVAIEAKIGRRQPTQEQRDFLAAVQRAGGIAGVARSVDDAIALLR